MESNDGGWTVLIRRVPGGNLTFGRGWTEYENGFGDLNTEFWYGLKNMHHLTNLEPMEVEVEVKQVGSAKIVLGYGHFLIDGPNTKYTLHVSEPKQGGFDSFAHHNGRKFQQQRAIMTITVLIVFRATVTVGGGGLELVLI